MMIMLCNGKQLHSTIFRLGRCWISFYLLIGFYFQRESATFANLKAFLINRIATWVSY